LRITQPLNNQPAGYEKGATAFLGLRYSSSAGFGNQLQAQAQATRVASSQDLVLVASSDLSQAIHIDINEYESAKTRIDSLQQTVEGGVNVLDSYQRQFQAGRKTWQDLLNAVRELAQNKYALADAIASWHGSAYRLQIRTGQEIQ
jgi:adhesin transport system outer membrane protein